MSCVVCDGKKRKIDLRQGPKKGYKLIRITLREFLEIFRAPDNLENQDYDYYGITRFALPADARAVSAQYDIAWDAFVVKIESVEFPVQQSKAYGDFIEPKRILLSGKTIKREG